MKESKNFLIIYAIVIFVLLILIIFILPDSFFGRAYEQNTQYFKEQIEKEKKEKEELEKEKKKNYIDFEEQKKQILNGTYDYEYIFIDSMGTETFTYKCTGSKKNEIETGTCSSPYNFSYTEQDKESKFLEKIEPTYIEAKNIFELIKNVKPSTETHQLYREFTYQTKIKDLDTTIIIQTKKDSISKITLLNEYMQYMINYNNVNIDN